MVSDLLVQFVKPPSCMLLAPVNGGDGEDCGNDGGEDGGEDNGDG